MFMKETFVPQRDHFQVIDFFAGAARITKLARGLGLAAACLDKDLSGVFDLNTDAGFMLLAAVKHVSSVEAGPRTCTHKKTPGRAVLRLALVGVLQSKENDVVAMLGVPCNTFIRVSQGSTNRCPFL